MSTDYETADAPIAYTLAEVAYAPIPYALTASGLTAISPREHLSIPCPLPNCDAPAGVPCTSDGGVHAVRYRTWDESADAAEQFRVELAAIGAVILPHI